MGNWFRRLRRVIPGRPRSPSPPPCRLGLEALETRCLLSAAAGFVQTNLVSDVPGLAQVTDAHLHNPWGMSLSSSSPFWISNNGTSTSTLYTVNGVIASQNSLVVDVPRPTGQVSNGDATAFLLANGQSAHFIFASLNGTISGWNTGTAAEQKVMTPGAVYTGLAIATTASGSFLYAADDAQGRIDTFDSAFAGVDLGPNAFVDPDLPDGLVPFGVQTINGSIYVAYAPAGRPAQIAAQEGDGAVAVFDTSGTFVRQLINGSTLASPWGMTLAPAGFGQLGGDLLVGNFAYNVSEINAFDPTTGAFLGTLTDPTGQKILNQALWGLTFGNGGNGGDPNTLYFAAGINGEADGLFGSIQAVPTISRHAPIVTNLANAPEQIVSTVPATNGDENPYGVAFVPPNFRGGGLLHPGDVLVSNFNNSDNLQGTGTTIVRIGPTGEHSIFFQGDTGLGLTTALGVLKSGFVIVGNVPTTDGTFDTIQPGSLLILDPNGHVVETLANDQLLDGPWDLAINDMGDRAQVFVSDVLSGTVTRIDLTIPPNGNPMVTSMTQIASGYRHEENDAALVVGPTGLAFDRERDLLYVASTDDNAVFAIRDAGHTRHDDGMGRLIYRDDAHLHGPLALALAPNGDLITANGDAVNEDDSQPSELVEFTRHGQFVGEFSVSDDPGGAFGLAVSSVGGVLRFAAVNDNANTLDLWTFKTTGHSDGEMGSDDRSGASAAVNAAPASAGGEVSASGLNDVAAFDQWVFATGRRSQADNESVLS